MFKKPATYFATLLCSLLLSSCASTPSYVTQNAPKEGYVMLYAPFGFWLNGGIKLEKIDGADAPSGENYNLFPGVHKLETAYFESGAHSTNNVEVRFDGKAGPLYCLIAQKYKKSWPAFDDWRPVVWAVSSEPPPENIRGTDFELCRKRAKELGL